MFGEAHQDSVRVVSIGMAVDKLASGVAVEDWDWCIELCGGTHVDCAGEIKEPIVLEESGIAKDIRACTYHG